MASRVRKGGSVMTKAELKKLIQTASGEIPAETVIRKRGTGGFSSSAKTAVRLRAALTVKV